MNTKIHIENQELEIAKATLQLWLGEKVKSAFYLTYIGETEKNETENSLNDVIYFADKFENKFGISFAGVSQFTYNKLKLSSALFSKTFFEIKAPNNFDAKKIYCFIIKETLTDKALGFIKYIPVKNAEEEINNNFLTSNLESATTYHLTTTLNKLTDNLSQAIFQLHSQNGEKSIFGRSVIFNNKFCLLVQEEKMSEEDTTTLRLELGDIKIPSHDLSLLKAGNILEISELEDLTAKILAGDTEIAQANFKYESGSISLKIFSSGDKAPENTLSSNESSELNNRFIRRFFTEYSNNNENLC